MMFKRTAISLCLFSLFASGAYAEPTLVNSVIEDQADIDALNLSADGSSFLLGKSKGFYQSLINHLKTLFFPLQLTALPGEGRFQF